MKLRTIKLITLIFGVLISTKSLTSIALSEYKQLFDIHDVSQLNKEGRVYRLGSSEHLSSFYSISLIIENLCRIYQDGTSVRIKSLTTYGSEENIELLKNNKLDFAMVLKSDLINYLNSEIESEKMHIIPSLLRNKIQGIALLQPIKNGTVTSDVDFEPIYLVANRSVASDVVYSLLKALDQSNYKVSSSDKLSIDKSDQFDSQFLTINASLHRGAIRFFSESNKLIPKALLP